MGGRTFLRSGAFKILVFFAGTVLLGAILAPPLYHGGKLVVEKGWIAEGPLASLHGSMDRAPFPRYFNRAILLGALLLVGPILRWMRADRDPRKKSLLEFLDLAPNPHWRRHLLVGFLAAGATLLLLGSAYVGLGWYAGRDSGEALGMVLLSALGTGLAVGFLEEFVFRGALYAVLGRVLGPRALFYTIAVFFAVIHFFHAPRSLDAEEVRWGTGFWMVGRIFQYFFSQFADPYFLLSEFLVLFAIGIVLGWVREETRSLWLGIGLHAGWVFGVKVLSPLTTRAFERSEMMPWLGDTLRVGLVSCIVVCLTGLGIRLWLRRAAATDRDAGSDREKGEPGDDPSAPG